MVRAGIPNDGIERVPKKVTGAPETGALRLQSGTANGRATSDVIMKLASLISEASGFPAISNARTRTRACDDAASAGIAQLVDRPEPVT